jgi:methyl-accepting chemotaxis protein
MHKLTIKQKLISMTVIISLLVTSFSIVFFNRFHAMTNTYNQIPKIYVPQQQIASLMTQMVLKEQMVIRKMHDIKTDLQTFEKLAAESKTNLHQFRVMNNALINGNANLGIEFPEFKGIVMEKAEPGNKIEGLIKKTGNAFACFMEPFELFMENKRNYLQSMDEIFESDKSGKKGLASKMADLRNKLAKDATETIQMFYITQIASEEISLLVNFSEKSVQRFNEMFSETNIFLFMSNVDPSRSTKVRPVLDQYILTSNLTIKKLRELKANNEEIELLFKETLIPKIVLLNEAVLNIKSIANEQMFSASVSAQNIQASSKNTIFILSIIVIGIGLGSGWFVSLKINKTLANINEVLDQSSEEVSAASAQISASSHFLLECSSQQAASIEQTRSTLDGISSMTCQNSDHSHQADKLMKANNHIVKQANEAMAHLTISIEDISSTSQETNKIIKIIDGIAFQTNLLALNAAVEAARAGEAGSGFAIVADEVRNLAMKAAEAAKNISLLIEGTVTKINVGSNLVIATKGAFKQVSESTSKVGGLVSEIALASNEQSQGILQVQNAVAELDKVAQQNASIAEETTGSSEVLNAQAQQMQHSVFKIIDLVGANKTLPSRI